MPRDPPNNYSLYIQLKKKKLKVSSIFDSYNSCSFILIRLSSKPFKIELWKL